MNGDEIFVETIKFYENQKQEFVYKIPIKSDRILNLDQFDDLSSTLAYLDKSYFSNTWKSTNDNCYPRQIQYITTDLKTAATALIYSLYGPAYLNNEKLEISSHLVDLKNYHIQDDEIKLEYSLKNLYNLHDILLYSPKNLDSHEKTLFILYQLIKFTKKINGFNLNLGELKLSDIFIDQNFWLRLKLPIDSILNLYKTEAKQQIISLVEDSFSIINQLEDVYESYKHLSHQDLANITKNWCFNKIDNFNYLLMLNCIAGKKLNCPFNHPIFPWITDFTSKTGNLRDLTQSKFRLNKGDAHLDLTYQASSPTGAYHLTEFLSEITFFVYKSRITDKDTLCKHVRRTWVPNEYPASVNRLYMWTPEECIPEFYYDINIFKSIHEDMSDLKLPEWASSPEEFIKIHRKLLESEQVSKNLHHWIDLVFGFKLSGDSAIEAKNVFLPLIDANQAMKTHGIVQLFNVPHPVRSINKTYHSEQSPFIKNKYRCNQIKSVSSESDLRKKTIVKNEELNSSAIYLPEDFNPLERLEQIESMLKFINKVYHCLPENEEKNENKIENNFEQLVNNDLKCLACNLCEIILFNKLKCLPQQNLLKTRYDFICKTINQEPHLITGCSTTVFFDFPEKYALAREKYFGSELSKKLIRRFWRCLVGYNNGATYGQVLKAYFSGKSTKTVVEPFQPFILSVLKPFNKLPLGDSKHSNFKYQKQLKQSYYMENMIKYQNQNLNVSTLLNPHLTVLPFKLFFENLYKFNEIAYKLDYLINEYDLLEKSYILKQLNLVIKQTGMLSMNRNVEDLAFYSSDETSSFEQTISIEQLHEQKFYLALLYLPKLMFDMSDPKKNFLSQSICVGNESYDLIVQYLINLFENPNTCVNSFLFLFNKLTKFLSKNEIQKRFLPILLSVLNIVDLSETMGIAFCRDDDKVKFCKLFDYTFINELRIIFGLEVFLSQIFPFLIEAISGFKDFDFESTLTKTDNISTVAFNCFQRVITTLGPVLTCKFCCNDLFKMLAICYMNQKCLIQIENSDNPLNSSHPIEGDRFANLILESLKTVAMFYGEQVIVAQYLPYVSNTISECTNRLSSRLEASLLAGMVLVNFSMNYLDLKLLMDELGYVINQILIPVIKIYSNMKLKFPNGYLMRQALAFKALDIILILSLRIGLEQTRILMKDVLKIFFDSFSQVRFSIMNPAVLPSKPIQIKSDSKYSTKALFMKPRVSIMSFNQRSNKQDQISRERLTSDEDDYLKVSVDLSNSLGGKGFEFNSSGTKFRTQSFGLLSLNNNEEDSDQQNNAESQEFVLENSTVNLGSHEEMVNTFTCELAHTAYMGISRLTSGNYIDNILSNGDLIHKMCLLNEQLSKHSNKTQSLNIKSKESESKSITGISITSLQSQRSKFSSSQSTSYGSSFSEHVSISGNQIQINSDGLSSTREESKLSLANNKFTLKFSENDLKDHKSKLDTSRHLSENWLAYWENEIRSGSKGNLFDFKHIGLLTLSGHTNTVKCIHSLDNESSFISGSKDKTVKLWSLKLHGGNKKNQQTCQWTYSHHKKPISSLLFLESLRVCVSCDGSVHIWNPFAGKKMFQFDNPTVTCMSNLSSPSSSFVVATVDNLVRFIDLRTKSYAYELKTCYAPSGSIKSISTTDNLLLVGFSTGLMSLIDMRTGWIQESCKSLDNEILQLKFYSNDRFLCSYSDGTITLSSIRDKVQVQNIIKCYNEPVPFISVNNNQLITSTASNKIGIHSNIDKSSQIPFSINKLQPDIFKGVITSQTYLPLNRLLLLGSDSGDIKLIC